ncbi:hypothetical protein D3C81_1283120 [compost metagenome]
MLEQGAQKHRGDQQQGRQQRALQHPLAFMAGTYQVHRRHQNHQQDRVVPDIGEYSQGFLHRMVLPALFIGTVANQVRHGSTQLDHQYGKRQGRQQAGQHGDRAGEVAAQLPGDLRAGQGIAQGHQKDDREQRARQVSAHDGHCRTPVSNAAIRLSTTLLMISPQLVA